MFRKIILATTALAGVTFAGSAFAQDMGDKVPFSGPYVQASGGYDVQSNDTGSTLTFDRNNDGVFGDTVTTAAGANAFSPGFCNGQASSSAPTSGCGNDHDAFSYYGRVGLDQRVGHFVIGVLGEFGKTEIRDYTSGFSTTPAAYVLERNVKWEASARARAGVAFGSGLFYVTGGGGYANIGHRFSTTNTANAFSDNGNRKKFGYVAGGGVEKYLTRNISFGMEYLYHDYKDNRYQVRVTQGTAPATNPFVLTPNTGGTTIQRSDENFRWHSLRGTLAFHF